MVVTAEKRIPALVVTPEKKSGCTGRIRREDGEIQRHDRHIFKWPRVLGQAGDKLENVPRYRG